MGLGIVVLLATIAIGERIGDRSLGTPLDDSQNLVPVIALTPAPSQESPRPYGPDWDSSVTLSSAPDPAFPDPRVPPKPLPTPEPAATAGPAAPIVARPTYNPNVPIWRQTPLPGTTPTPAAKPSASPSASPAATPQASPKPGNSAGPEPSPAKTG